MYVREVLFIFIKKTGINHKKKLIPFIKLTSTTMNFTYNVDVFHDIHRPDFCFTSLFNLSALFLFNERSYDLNCDDEAALSTFASMLPSPVTSNILKAVSTYFLKNIKVELK